MPFLKPLDDSEEGRQKTLTARWGRFVCARAKIVFPVVLLIVLALASTSSLVRLGAADQGTQPKEQTSRRAYDLLAEGFGPGFNGPIPIVVNVNGDPGAPQRIVAALQGVEDVAKVDKPQFNDDKSVAIVFVTPNSAPQDKATDDLVDRLRDDVVPAALAGGDARAYVSGQTAAFKDIADRIFKRSPYFLLYIVGVTFLVLTMAFRSVVISLTAAITTILSALVGFGVLTMVVQEGHLLGLTGLDKTGPIETFVPPIAFAILFGLSMDYMVFLISRIREKHVQGEATRAAVEHGIAAIGRVIVAAAIIMGTVFAAFILSADRVPKEFGLLLAVAILTDALIVRMTLIPSMLTLLGEKSWYIPRWLDRILPNLTIEAPHDGAVRGPEPERPREVGQHALTARGGRTAGPPSAGAGNPCLSKRLRIDDPATPPPCSSRSAPDSRRVWPSASLPAGRRPGAPTRPAPARGLGRSPRGWGSVSRARARSSPGCPSSTRRR